jgi:hypothetical protein
MVPPMTDSVRTLRITTPALSADEPFQEMIGALLAYRDAGDHIQLDLSEFDLAGSQRLRPLHLLLLANVVLGAAGDTPMSLVMPNADTARLAVLRSGLLFSLASRPRPICAGDINGLAVSNEIVQRWLNLWQIPWSPAQPALGRLFEDEPRPVDRSEVLANARNAKNATRVVIDPHLESRESLLRQASNGLAGAWLRSVTPVSQDRAVQHRRDLWKSLVTARVLGEPLINLPDHALTCPPGADPLERHVRSMVLLARTDGGGEESRPRLHMLVVDNGYGLVRTLRPKLSRQGATTAERKHAGSSATELVAFALSRPAKTVNDPGLPWARASFATAVAGAMSDSKEHAPLLAFDLTEAEFTVIAGDPADKESAVWASTPASDDAEVQGGALRSVPFTGTTVFASLPIPHGTDRSIKSVMSARHGGGR